MCEAGEATQPSDYPLLGRCQAGAKSTYGAGNCQLEKRCYSDDVGKMRRRRTLSGFSPPSSAGWQAASVGSQASSVGFWHQQPTAFPGQGCQEHLVQHQGDLRSLAVDPWLWSGRGQLSPCLQTDQKIWHGLDSPEGVSWGKEISLKIPG